MLYIVLLLYSGRMSDFDYAVISEWFEWVMRNSAVGVDLIGMFNTQCVCVYVVKLYVVCYDQRDVDMLHTNLSSAENCFWFSENQTVRYFAFHGVGFPSQLPARCGFQCQYTE